MTDHYQTLLTKIKGRQAMAAVIGLGNMGLHLAVKLAQAGFRTVGLDPDPARVEALNQGRSYLTDLRTVEVLSMVKAGKLSATTDYSLLRQCDTVSICVPPPLQDQQPRPAAGVVAATEAISDFLHPAMLIVLVRSTFPGTTEEINAIRVRIFQQGLELGRDIFVAFLAERIEPGRTDCVLENIPTVVGGVTPSCSQMADALYRCVTGVEFG